MTENGKLFFCLIFKSLPSQIESLSTAGIVHFNKSIKAETLL